MELLDPEATEITCFGIPRLLLVNAPDSALRLVHILQYLQQLLLVSA